MSRLVNRSVLLPLCALAIALLGASPLIVPTPAIVVYPLIPNGSGVSPETGARLSVAIATQIAQMGGVTVKPAPPGIEQHDYLDVARKLGVDYYVSGYVTPLGGEASVVEQVVSATSGSIVWSTTAELTTYGEAVGQGTLIRQAILAYAARAVSSLAPIPVTSTPSPAPTAAPVVMPKKVAVLSLSGDGAADRVEYATRSLLRALAKNKVSTARDVEPAPDLKQLAGTICAKTGATLLLGGTLSLQSPAPSSATANVVVMGYDCTGAQVGQQAASSEGAGKNAWQAAIDRAVGLAVSDYLHTQSAGS